MEKISIREAARRLGVSDTAVHKAVKDGRVSPPTPDASGRAKLEWPRCRDEWLAHSDVSKRSHVGSKGGARRADQYANTPEVRLPVSAEMDAGHGLDDIDAGTQQAGGRQGGPKSGRDSNYAGARAAREVYMAKLAKLEFEEKSGKLVDADEVRAAWYKHINAAKVRITGIPATCKSRYPELPLGVIALIEDSCREALEGLANGDRDS